MIASTMLTAQDWAAYEVPANAGEGMTWALQSEVSDDFNYTSDADEKSDEFKAKWTDFYHNNWTGPAPTVWKRNHSYVADGKLKLKSSRTEGETTTISSGGQSYTLPTTNLACITSQHRIKYPVYVECYVKIMNSVLASDVWLLSPDDTQEIDICEAYGGERYTNDWFSNKRLHLSHHVFIRSPFADWQPSDEGSFYTDGTTVWSNDYHRIGVYWKDPWNLEYYVDGQLVRTRSGKNQIDPNYYTNAVNQGDTDNDTRTGLSKEMDIIINTEDQTWRAIQGLSPTDRELGLEDDNTFNVDWIRIYKPVSASAIEEQELSTLKMYPNPIENTLKVSSTETLKHLYIYDLQGGLMQESALSGQVACIDTKHLIAGHYLVSTELNNGKIIHSRILKH